MGIVIVGSLCSELGIIPQIEVLERILKDNSFDKARSEVPSYGLTML